MILFVFLPALVFESAYAVDQHALYKERGAVLTLAGPALLLSTALIGGAMYLLTWGAWQWPITAALVFGALISATDPVAVVAILREVNAPKRLGVLIEGESLFNDGTAIVVFMVLIDLLGNPRSVFSLGGTLMDFVFVVVGGVLVGLFLGVTISWWMARTFNDPLVEIAHTVVVAYLAMLVAEGPVSRLRRHRHRGRRGVAQRAWPNLDQPRGRPLLAPVLGAPGLYRQHAHLLSGRSGHLGAARRRRGHRSFVRGRRLCPHHGSPAFSHLRLSGRCFPGSAARSRYRRPESSRGGACAALYPWPWPSLPATNSAPTRRSAGRFY